MYIHSKEIKIWPKTGFKWEFTPLVLSSYCGCVSSLFLSNEIDTISLINKEHDDCHTFRPWMIKRFLYLRKHIVFDLNEIIICGSTMHKHNVYLFLVTSFLKRLKMSWWKVVTSNIHLVDLRSNYDKTMQIEL